MKKILMIVGILVIMALMLNACGPKEAYEEKPAAPDLELEVEEEEITEEEIVVEEPEEVVEDEPKEVIEDEPEETPTEEEPKKVEPGISQEDLDKLKEDLEEMEFEDLGGLAE